jgi:translation initiation factor IF-3
MQEVLTISDYMINEQIRDREVRLVGENGEQLGIMSAFDALKLAQEKELDLVKIAPRAKPPVCKIIDYGKYRYEQVRKQKEARKKQKIIELKEVRLSPNIDVNDMNTKVTAARKEAKKSATAMTFFLGSLFPGSSGSLGFFSFLGLGGLGFFSFFSLGFFSFFFFFFFFPFSSSSAACFNTSLFSRVCSLGFATSVPSSAIAG